MEIIGWVGSGLLAICSAPQCWQTYKTRKVDDINIWYLWLWLLGIIGTAIYVGSQNLATGNFQVPLFLNYVTNTFMASYLIYAKYSYKTS